MELDKTLTVDDLITAFLEYEENKGSLEKITDYYKLRLDLMQELFGVDFAEAEKRISPKEFPRGQERNPEKYYEFNALMTISNFNHCIMLLRINKNPFRYGWILAGMPPKISRDLEEKYGDGASATIENLNSIYRDVAKELLAFMFPGVESKQIDGKKLYELGLPEEEPDYFELLLEEEDSDDFD